eukprot:UN19923
MMDGFRGIIAVLGRHAILLIICVLSTFIRFACLAKRSGLRKFLREDRVEPRSNRIFISGPKERSCPQGALRHRTWCTELQPAILDGCENSGPSHLLICKIEREPFGVDKSVR